MRCFSIILAAALNCSSSLTASAQPVTVVNSPGSAPACHQRSDLLALTTAITARDFKSIRELTVNLRCWGVWDGSRGELIATDETSGIGLVSFEYLERLPEGRHEMLWVNLGALAAQ